MADSFAQIFLSFTHEIVLIPLFLVGLTCIDKKIFFHGLCLFLTSMIYAYSLKITFQIPLLPSLGKAGFAFPSGHMLSAISIYGWIFFNMRSLLWKLLVVILLFGIGLSLVHFNYHNYFDVVGAVFFGILLIFLYKLIINFNVKEFSLIVFTGNTILLFYCAVVDRILPHLWVAYSALIALLLLRLFLKEKSFIDF